MSALQTTHSDLAKVLTGLIGKPVQAKASRNSPKAALAMKLAWEGYTKHAACHTERYGFNRRLFASHLESAWYLAKCWPKGPVEVTTEECLHIAGKR